MIKDSTAWLLTSAMEDVINVEGATGNLCQLDFMPAAGKTGTTESYNDLWFLGYTPYDTCAVWSGLDNNEKLPEYARDFHKELWRKVMNRIHQDLPYRDFPMPVTVQRAAICEETGLLPVETCNEINEFFEAATIPTQYCPGHYRYYEEEYDLDSFVTYNTEGYVSPDGVVLNGGTQEQTGQTDTGQQSGQDTWSEGDVWSADTWDEGW